MRIRSVTLEDVGLFRGRQTLDLYPRTKYGAERPVVLVGGHNGAGKTTTLEALRLALYGRLALGNRVTDRSYSDYLRGTIHRRRDTLIPTTSASVAVEFEHSRAGQRNTYVVRRAWSVQGERVDERLDLLRDGAPLPDIEQEFWPEFVRGLVPYGLSQLFFFDGEKIQRLAEEESESETLAESVKALLGLDLVERLDADLGVLIERRVKSQDLGQRGRRLADIERRLGEVVKEEEALATKNAQVNTALDGATRHVERIEQKLAHAGKGIAGRREDLSARASSMQTKIEGAEKALRELCEGAFPFALCPALADAVVRQIDDEAAAERWHATRQEVRSAFQAATKRVSARLSGEAKILKGARDLVSSELRAALSAYEETRADLDSVPRIHGASDRERDYLRQVLEGGRRESLEKAEELVKELASAEDKLSSTKKRLNTAPDNDELRPLFEDLSRAQEKRATLSAQVTTLSEQREALAREREKLERERRKIVDAEADRQKGEGQVALAGRARQALNAYLERLTVAKVQRLEVEAVECFKQLCRKDDLVQSMAIDPTTYRVTLKDRRGRELPKHDLSAGEKQLYAVALLWALARVSGRPLPMVIDTPLGRLDSVHRQNLIERYLPKASHQVIVLSTDTEVDQACFETLRPRTSHALHLQHHQLDGWTEVQAGYFWKGESRAASAIA